jgi:hypothetical protein
MTVLKKTGWIVLAGIAFGLLIWVVLFPSLFGLPLITLMNRSHIELRSVQIDGSGFSVRLPTLLPDESKSITVEPQGESGVSISFQAEGKDLKTDNLSYVEPFGGYCVTIEIDPAFKITADGGLSCFSLRRLFH